MGVDISSCAHIYNKKKNILLLGIGPTQRLEHTLTANSYLFVNGTEIYKFKAKDSETVVGPICLGKISKDWSVDNMKKTGFAVDDTIDIHKYLMKKSNIV